MTVYLACHCGARAERDMRPAEPVARWNRPCDRTMHEYDPPAWMAEARANLSRLKETHHA